MSRDFDLFDAAGITDPLMRGQLPRNWRAEYTQLLKWRIERGDDSAETRALLQKLEQVARNGPKRARKGTKTGP